MKRLLLAIVISVVGLAAHAEAESDLHRLLRFQRASDPGAFISSGFYDWRTVSRYRRQPGLHNGYDIAMLGGTPVRAAWSGQVVAITPWATDEYGVTVRCRISGSEITYGHLVPSVSVGQAVTEGQVVGLVAIDHVDVKVRDPLGRFVDIAVEDGLPEVAPPSQTTPPSHDPVRQEQLRKLEAELDRARRLHQQGLVSTKAVQALEQRCRKLRGEEAPERPPTDELEIRARPSIRTRTDELVLHTHFTPVSEGTHGSGVGSGSADSESSGSERQAAAHHHRQR